MLLTHLQALVKDLSKPHVLSDGLAIYRRLQSDDQDSVRLLTVEDLVAIAQQLTPAEVHEQLLKQPSRTKQAPPESAAIITIQGTSVQWVPVQEMVKHADMKNRRGTHSWWEEHTQLVEALVARPQILAKGKKEEPVH